MLCAGNSGGEESVTVLVPPALAGDTVNVVVRSGGNESRPKTYPVLHANPGILETLAGGKRTAILLHASGAMVAAANPLRRGEVLSMFVTGIGAPGAHGPQFPFIVGVNNRGASLRSVNCGACASGIAELRFELPQETPSGGEINLSTAVVVNGTPVYSNSSTLAVP